MMKTRIVNRGMGGFLNPPTHPEHFYSVEGSNFSYCLSGAIMSGEYIDQSVVRQVNQLLTQWQPPEIDSPEIQDWILQVMGYFAGCYQGANESFNASDLQIRRKGKGSHRPPTPDKHAGVHFIRKFYPDFMPTAYHFAAAKWGK